MSLKEDLETMQRHHDNGTLKEWLRGDAAPAPNPMPSDPTTREGLPLYTLIKQRGD